MMREEQGISVMADEYGIELEAIAARLQTVGEASIRGEGIGRFIYAFCDTRAVEVSRAGERLFVEFFDVEVVIRDHMYSSSDEATKAALDWLVSAR
jgi:hypothetical protein